MNLEILTPESKIFSGDVYGVQLPGISGSFELLDKHAPMVSALKNGKLKILKDKKLYESIANNARKLVEVQYSYKSIAQKLDDVYLEAKNG